MPRSHISVREAGKQFKYSESHLRDLLSRGVIEGEKFANVWMVDSKSIEKHRIRMEQLGVKKHGLRASTSG